MAEKVVMPKQGNSVESCVIDEWKKKEGDTVEVGEILCEAETDKSTIEVESTAAGTILKILYQEGDDVPVMLPIAIVGQSGEDISALLAEAGASSDSAKADAPAAAEPAKEVVVEKKAETVEATGAVGTTMASPRARNLAAGSGLDLSGVAPTGPKGRIIERDVKSALEGHQPLTPTALAAVQQGTEVPAFGSGIGGRVLLRDLKKKVAAAGVAAAEQIAFPGNVTEVPVKGVRKVTAKRKIGRASCRERV